MLQISFPLVGDRRFSWKVEGLLVGLVCLGALVLGLFFRHLEQERKLLAEAHFKDRARLVLSALEGELFHLVLLNQGAKAFLEAETPVTQSRWNSFFLTQDLTNSYPALSAFFWVQPNVKTGKIQASYSFPLGWDLSKGLLEAPENQRALEQSNESHQMQLGPIGTIPGLGEGAVGFLCVLPLQGNGFLVSLVDLDRYVRTSMGPQFEQVHVEISQGEQTLYSTPVAKGTELNLAQTFGVQMGGQNWTVLLEPSVGFFLEHQALLGENRSWGKMVWLLFLGWLSARFLLYTEVEKRSAQVNLAATVKEKDRVLGLIAHDLKSPFNSLLTTLNLLVHEDLDKETQTQAHLSLYHTASLAFSLLLNLLDWGRRQEGALRSNPKWLSLEGEVEQIVQLLQSGADHKKVLLVREIKGSWLVWADSNLLQTVLRNLIGNAIKFSNPGGEVVISARPTAAGLLSITVSDSGVGMDEAHLAGLKRGERMGSKLGTHNEVGSGLGIVLCQEFVGLCGGKLEIKSKLDQGSSFTFTLKAAASPS